MDQLFHELAKVLAERKKKRKSAFYVVFNERVDRIADILEKMKCKRKKRKKKRKKKRRKRDFTITWLIAAIMQIATKFV